MKQIDQENLDMAITLGDALCKELGICCDRQGQVIFQIYRKLREMKPEKDVPVEPEVFEAEESDSTPSSSGGEV